MKALVILALLASCVSTRTRDVSAIELRVASIGAAWATYSAEDQQLIGSGRFRPGLDEMAVYVARGAPALYWNTSIGSRPCRVLLYDFDGAPGVESTVYTCDGSIIYAAPLARAIPCWRVADVGPRIAVNAAYFEGQPLDRQWDIVLGFLRRGQSAQDIYIAFGNPYNRGSETREDGTHASSQVFLDPGREAYGLYVTFVQDRVVAWRVPAERTLTPEAQQARLDATERRLMDRLRQMEAAAQERHKEMVTFLEDTQRNAAIAATLDAVVSAAGASIVGEIGSSGSEETSNSSESTSYSGSVKQEKDGTIRVNESVQRKRKTTRVRGPK